MRNMLCLVGRHSWQHHADHETGGRAVGYDLCRRCGRERPSYDAGNPSFKERLWLVRRAGRPGRRRDGSVTARLLAPGGR